MSFVFQPALLWFGLCGGPPLAIALWLLWRRPSRAALWWSTVMLSEVAWIVGQAVELSATGLQAKLWWDGLQWPPLCVLGAASAAFAHAYTGTPMPRRLLWLYAGGAIPSALLLATAPLHGIVRSDARVKPGTPFASLEYAFTPWDFALTLITLSAAVYAIALLSRHATRVHRAHLASALLVTFGLTLPTLGSVLGVSLGLRVLGQRDLSFLFFGASGLLVTIGLRQRLFDLVPLARDAVFDRVPDAALVLDASGRVADINRAAVRLFGTPADSALGRSMDGLKLGQQTLSAVLSNIRCDSEPTRLAPDPDGIVREVSAQPFDTTGARILLLRDVTAQHRIEQILRKDEALLRRQVDEGSRALEESERRFRALFEHSFQYIGMLSPQGHVIEANDAALALVGAELAEVKGMPCWETPWWRHSADERAKLRAGVQEAAAGRFVRFETSHLDTAGKLRCVDFSLTPVRGAEGNVAWIIAEGRDITELREAEQRFQQAQKMEALGRLAGGVAHDFNNLLTVIAGSASLLRDPQQDEDAKLLDQIHDAVESAAGLTRQMLAFSRKSVVQSQPINVSEAIDRLVRMTRRLLPATITVEVDVQADLWTAQFDDAQLQQVLLNLAVNARDAMPSGGTLSFHAENTRSAHPESPAIVRDWVRIDVRDTGQGMAPEALRMIFDPFFTTKASTKGTGLGLAMVYGALSQHGGFVQVQSNVDRGSNFQVYLRRATAVQSASDSAPKPPSRQTAGQHVIYLVEDEPGVRAVIAATLDRAGLHVHAFEHPTALLTALPTLQRPDLLITDLIMPGMSGREMARHLLEHWPGLPVLYMSGYTDDQHVPRSASGSDAFLMKPFQPQGLLDAVTSALREAQPVRAHASGERPD